MSEYIHIIIHTIYLNTAYNSEIPAEFAEYLDLQIKQVAVNERAQKYVNRIRLRCLEASFNYVLGYYVKLFENHMNTHIG